MVIVKGHNVGRLVAQSPTAVAIIPEVLSGTTPRLFRDRCSSTKAINPEMDVRLMAYIETESVPREEDFVVSFSFCWRDLWIPV